MSCIPLTGNKSFSVCVVKRHSVCLWVFGLLKSEVASADVQWAISWYAISHPADIYDGYPCQHSAISMSTLHKYSCSKPLTPNIKFQHVKSTYIRLSKKKKCWLNGGRSERELTVDCKVRSLRELNDWYAPKRNLSFQLKIELWQFD